MSISSKLLVAAGGVIVLLHVWGMLEPSHLNWGAHFFSFHGVVFAPIALALVIIAVTPRLSTAVLDGIDSLVRHLSRIPVPILLIGTAGVLIGGAFLFPAQLHMLGDGAVLLRSVPHASAGGGIAPSFRNQPFMQSVYNWAMSLHQPGSRPDAYTVYFTIDLIAAVVFTITTFWFIRRIQRPALERFLIGCFLFGTGSSQFFFGYVENYVLQYVFTLLFVFSGWFALENRVHVVLPILAFVAVVGFHLGNLVLTPALLLLIFWRFRKKKLHAILVVGLMGALGVGATFILGINPLDITRRLTGESFDFLKLFTTGGGNFPYPMFSLPHVIDWANAHLLIAPFGLAIAVTLLVIHRRELDWKHPALLFLLTATVCGLLFTWIINPALGMARDWDLLSSFLMPLVVLDIFLLALPISIQPRRYVLLLVAVVTIVHTVAWIGVNANTEKHLQRMRLLNSPYLLSPVSQIVHAEALANYFFGTGKYAEARTYYEHFMSIESTNPRIIANIADVYRKLGEKELYFEMLLRAVEANSKDAGVYSNLGVEYAQRGDTLKAIEFNERALSLDPRQHLAHANLGILYATRGMYQLAQKRFASAIELGMREPIVYRYAGDVSMVLNDYPAALRFYTSYLEYKPGDERVRSTIEKLRNTLIRTN